MNTSAEPIRVVIAEDHAIVRAGLKLLVDSQPDMSVVGEAENGEDAISLSSSLHPHVVLMDIAMPGTDGIRATRRIKITNPKIKILVLTRHDEDGYLQQLIAAGADGYVLKQSPPSDVVDAVRTVFSGRSYLDHSLTRNVMVGFSGKLAAGKTDGENLSQLESNVLRLVAFGNSHKEIAKVLAVGVRTAETARGTAMKKLGLESRVDVVRYAIKHGWMRDN